MFRKLLNPLKIFYFFLAIAIALFTFYPPVCFHLYDQETSQISNKIVLISFFIIMVAISIYSLIIFNKSSKSNIEAFEGILVQLKPKVKDDFEDKLYILKNIFSQSTFKEVWQKYEKTIRHIDSGTTIEGEVKFKQLATVEADYFFNEDIVYKNLPNYKFINYVPQMLTALGIFGTFLGLVTGLVGLDFNDVSNTQNSIKLLLNGVQISFRTSIYGIAFSLILTAQQKFLLQVQEAKVAEIGDYIDSIFPLNTQADGINQLYVELEKQTASIQKMGTEIAEAVTNKFDSSLQKTLGPTLERFTQTTEQLIEVVRNSNQSTISSIVDNIGTIISSSTGQELERLKSSIGTMTERNESLLSNFEKTITTLESLIESQKSVISETNASADNAQKVNTNISLVTNELLNIISDLNSFANNQQLSYNGYGELTRNIRETLEQQDKSITIFKEMVQQSMSSLQLQKDASDSITAMFNKLGEFNHDFDGILENLKSQVSFFENSSNNICDKFTATMLNLENSHENISSSIQGLAAGLNESIKKLNLLVSEDLTNINLRYSEIMKNISVFSEDSDKLVGQLATFTETNQGAADLWRNYKESFDSLNEEINKGVVDYTLNVREGLQNLFQDYDEHISKVLSEFKSTIDNFQASIDELTEIMDQQTLREIQQQTSKVIHEGNSVIKAFGGKLDELKDVYRETEAIRMATK